MISEITKRQFHSYFKSGFDDSAEYGFFIGPFWGKYMFSRGIVQLRFFLAMSARGAGHASRYTVG